MGRCDVTWQRHPKQQELIPITAVSPGDGQTRLASRNPLAQGFMLTPRTLQQLLERLLELRARNVAEVLESLQHEQLALLPWPGLERAVVDATLHAVSFANARGGDLIFGIAPDGRVQGVNAPDTHRLARAVFAQTRPGILVDVWHYPTDEGVLVVVSTPEGQTTHATADGLRIRRVGRENLPLTPDQDLHVQTERGDLDYSDRTLTDLSRSALDPMQILYLREILRRKSGSADLLEQDDEGLLRTLGLLDERGAPRVAGLLLLGHKALLRERIPQSEVVYIHLTDHGEPDVQESLYLPLLHTLSRVQDLIEARNHMATLRQGLFHFQIKTYDEEVIREALVNALVHRDYSRRDGMVQIVHSRERLELSNPGTFIGGISAETILYHPPRHRNRRLTEVLQQLGLMERAGMGVNRLYRSLLRRGKGAPEYEVSPESIRLTLEGGVLDEPFARFISDEEARGQVFSLDMLIVLSQLKRSRTIDRASAARACQRTDRQMLTALTRMVDQGYLERLGGGRGTTYRLSGRVHALLGTSVAYFRDRGLSRRRQRALILEVVEELSGIALDECQELCGTTGLEARNLLDELVEEGLLLHSEGRWTLASAPPRNEDSAPG